MISAKDLKEASVAARRRWSDYPISIGSDYPITLIFHGFNEEKRRTQCCSSQKVLGLSELNQLGLSGRRIIRWSLASDYPTFLAATATFRVYPSFFLRLGTTTQKEVSTIVASSKLKDLSPYPLKLLDLQGIKGGDLDLHFH